MQGAKMMLGTFSVMRVKSTRRCRSALRMLRPSATSIQLPPSQTMAARMWMVRRAS